MTQVIPQGEWSTFFDDLTKQRLEWLTKIEVIGEEMGSQVLADGLSLVGITFEDQHGKSVIEIILGKERGGHHTHNIIKPTSVAYMGDEEKPSGIVEIMETDGTKTLIHIIQPKPLVIKFGVGEKIAASG